MKKKIFAIIFTIIFSQILCGYAYAKKCKKCLETAENNKRYFPEIGIAHRDFETPIIHKDGKSYATYKCCYGHIYLVDLDD